MITITVTTKDRSDYLIRLLNYYAEVEYKHWIFIADSSNEHHLKKTKEAIARLEGKLKIVHREYPGKINAECHKYLSDLITTPYVAFIGDDDFLIPNSLEKCVGFLEKNPQYSSAHGAAVLFSAYPDGPYGEMRGVRQYSLRENNAEKASLRLSEYLNNYFVVMFAVHRRKTWQAMFKYGLAIKDKSFADELLPCSLSLVYGKAKKLDCFYMLRQGHERRYLLPTWFDWITNPKWFLSYDIFRKSLAEGLVKQEGVLQEEANKIVEQAFFGFLRRYLIRKIDQPIKNPVLKIRQKLKEIVKLLPGIRRFWNFIKDLRPRAADDLSLPALLNPKSKYHDDFMPVYRIIEGSK